MGGGAAGGALSLMSRLSMSPRSRSSSSLPSRSPRAVRYGGPRPPPGSSAPPAHQQQTSAALQMSPSAQQQQHFVAVGGVVGVGGVGECQQTPQGMLALQTAISLDTQAQRNFSAPCLDSARIEASRALKQRLEALGNGHRQRN